MPNREHEVYSYNPRHIKIFILYCLLAFAFLIFLIAVFSIMVSSRENMPNLYASKTFIPLRGSIYSSDGLPLATSKKLYKASTKADLIYQDKKDLFAKVFSIYTGLDQSRIRRKLDSRPYVFLSYDLSLKKAQGLEDLSRKLYALGVFKKKRNRHNRLIYQGIKIQESGEKRLYVHKDAFTPILGYVSKVNRNDDFIHIGGIKGLEKYYSSYLDNTLMGELSGKKDISSLIIFNGDSKIQPPKNGADIFLNISLDFQMDIEKILSKYKNQLRAEEIIASVMDSRSGKVITLASSNRFNPSKITKEDYPSLNASAIERVFEPGSVIKPIILAKLLEDGILNSKSIVSGHNGKFKLRAKTITDEHPEAWFNISSAIVHSSNIAMAQWGLMLKPKDFLNYIKDIGLTKTSGIDLEYEKVGVIPTLKQLNADLVKAGLSYGYGASMNFVQLLKIYSMFSNEGVMVSPRLVDYLITKDKNSLSTKSNQKRVLSSKTADMIKNILIKTVQSGTTRAVYTEGLEIGAKTGTAQISKGGKYVKEYISSVFGFANDSNSSYTIGVTTFLPKTKYFASQTSAKVFKEIIDTMIKHKYLHLSNSKGISINAK